MSDGSLDTGPRARRLVQQDQSRASATVDAYPDDPAEPPRLRLFIVAFLPNGDSYDGEAIDTDGLDTREFTPGLATAKRQRWLASRTVAAQARLLDRIGETVDDG